MDPSFLSALPSSALPSFLTALTDLARSAGEAILLDKRRTTDVSFKSDESPLTSADLASNKVILAGLGRIAPELPVMSEESKAVPFSERKSWNKYFLVDPLDGTKEFIKGKKEYTVNIALIDSGVPVLGVVYVPELSVCYSGSVVLGAFRQVDGQAPLPIKVADASAATPRVVGSSSHASPEMLSFLDALGKHELMQFGSSLKICQVADGTADVYPRFGPTSEWDTGAGHAVVLASGGRVVTFEGRDLTYNQRESVLNPPFLVIGPEDHDWVSLAANAVS